MSHLEHTVDARFAGGHITVATTTLPHDNTLTAVRVTTPGFDFPLFDHEAAAIAELRPRWADSVEVTDEADPVVMFSCDVGQVEVSQTAHLSGDKLTFDGPQITLYGADLTLAEARQLIVDLGAAVAILAEAGS